VLLSEQADLSQAYSMRDQDARGWYVYNALKATAERSQRAMRAALEATGVFYKSYWVANMLVVTGNRALVNSLSARSDVRAIESNRSFKGIDDPVITPNPSSIVHRPSSVEWGVQNVNAPQVWAMSYTGQGIVIGNQDTGMRWTHNALKPHYRGWNGTTEDHNFNWWDSIHSGGGSCGPNTTAPCDDHGHGTHTTGTTVGDDGAGNQVGVAPGAKWIGCRNMDVGNGTPATYTECFQFFLAPTDLAGNNANPALRPHVMNNSWGCPTSEGCAATTLQTIVENTQAAGIFVEASAGNSGSSCGSVTDPPALYAAAFSTGAIDISNTLASFSSRGPVTVDGSNRLKPNISAPGVNVNSSTRSSDSSYGGNSGTSMAGPHVVGVIALLWSAHPELSRMITETKTLLQNTANPTVVVSPAQTCGGTPSGSIPNNSFGYGRVDALAAVNGAGPTATPTPTVTGTPPTATNTPPPTNTGTPTATNTRTFTRTPSRTATPTTTRTPTRTATGAASNTPLNTSTRTNTSTITPTDTYTNTPTNAPTSTNTPASVQVVGHVTIQGRPPQPHPLQSVPLTLSLHLSPSGPTSEYTGITTDDNGYFTVTAPTQGIYDWRVKNPQTLANSGTIQLPVAGYRLKVGKPQPSTFNIQLLTQVEMGLLLMGDVNNDNCVNVVDVNILRGTFGKASGDAGYDPRADFTGDNAVTLPDFNLLRANFGMCGAGPVLR
jgi:serine protease AprX